MKREGREVCGRAETRERSEEECGREKGERRKGIREEESRAKLVEVRKRLGGEGGERSDEGKRSNACGVKVGKKAGKWRNLGRE